MGASREQQNVISEARVYLSSRVLLFVVLAAGFATKAPLPDRPNIVWVYLSLLVLLGAATAFGFSEFRRGTRALARAMSLMLIPDLMVVAGYTNIFHNLEDLFFPVACLLTVSYVLVARRRDMWIVGAAISGAYMVGHLLAHPLDLTSYVALILKTASISMIGAIVAWSVSRQREREESAVRAVADGESVERHLQSRLAELQAVVRITNTIHSSLELDDVGPQLLEVLGSTLEIDTCSLLVVDKSNAETVFSASRSVGSSADSHAFDSSSALLEHLSCRSVCDNHEAMVVFCAEQSSIDGLSTADELVLSAVGNQLVVAAENARLFRLTRRLAITDELTGLNNYRELQSRLIAEVERASRYNSVLSLLMIDADDFKDFNDEHGHIAGDMALVEIGAAMRSVVREVDLVARYGGEEFAVMLPETDAAGAFVVAEKIREAIANHGFSNEQGKECEGLTVSVGMASYPAHARDKETLLKEADRALYDAKSRGKNRVCSSHPRSLILAAEPNGD